MLVKWQTLVVWENPPSGGWSRYEDLKLVLESSHLWAPSKKMGLKRVHTREATEGSEGQLMLSAINDNILDLPRGGACHSPLARGDQPKC